MLDNLRRWLALTLVAFSAANAPAADSPAASAGRQSEALVSRIKAALVERRFKDVLDGTVEFDRLFPDSPKAGAVSLYRGRALSAIGGREREALEAYRRAEQLASRDNDEGLGEEARRSACQVAFVLAASGSREGASALSEGLADPSRDVRIYAAILASRLTAPALIASAARVLEQELERETNPDLRDEMTLALARIDPYALEQSRAQGKRADATRSGAEQGKTRWIHVKITKRSDPKKKVQINLPISFARAVLDALPKSAREEIRGQAEAKGLSWDALTTALDEMKRAPGALFLADDGDERVEIWVD